MFLSKETIVSGTLYEEKGNIHFAVTQTIIIALTHPVVYWVLAQLWTQRRLACHESGHSDAREVNTTQYTQQVLLYLPMVWDIQCRATAVTTACDATAIQWLEQNSILRQKIVYIAKTNKVLTALTVQEGILFFSEES